MSNDRTVEEWGRAAVALPGAPECWGDLEGQDGHDAPGAVCADGTWWLPDSADGMFLDVDHPATAGCLLALLGGDDHVTHLIPAPDGSWFLTVALRPDPADVTEKLVHVDAPSLGRACIAAAEAIGWWPGGDQ